MITLDQVKQLREMTGAGLNAVREALEQANGNQDEAIKILRQKGVAKADKRKERVASNGIIGTYIHPTNRVVIVVEVDCETDFAANSEDMKKFANDMAVQVAAMSPKYIRVEDIESQLIDAEKEVYMKELEGKPENIQETILSGKLEKFYKEIVLLKQDLFVDDSKTVKDYLDEMVAKIGEKIEIVQFGRFEVAKETVMAKQ